jgi:hypothetical protein
LDSSSARRRLHQLRPFRAQVRGQRAAHRQRRRTTTLRSGWAPPTGIHCREMRESEGGYADPMVPHMRKTTPKTTKSNSKRLTKIH